MIIDAAIQRRRYTRDKEALEKLAKIKPGDTVKVNRQIKPAYLAGRVGEVVEVDRQRRRGVPMVAVDFQFPIRRYGAVIVMPAGSLEIIPRQEELEGVTTL